MRYLLTLLVSAAALLTGFGIIMIGSASTIRADDLHGQPYYFVLRQVAMLGLALVSALAAIRFDYHWWQRRPAQIALVLLTLGGLVAVFVPPFGHLSHGSHRWLGYGSLRIQPSELAKIAFVILAALWLGGIGKRVRHWFWGFVAPGAGTVLIALLLIIEPDFGSTALVGFVAVVLMFVAGTRLLFLVPSGLAALTGFALLVLRDPVRRERVLAFLWPERNPRVAHHLLQAKAAFMSGGAWGVGPGESIQKHYYLPEAHTDSILAIAGEELGVLASVGVVLLFGLILYCGIRIALRAPDKLGQLMATGLTLLLAMQAGINVGVMTGCLPTKGMALPFISYGGSSLVGSWLAVAVLVNIGRHVDMRDEHIHTRLFKNAIQRP